VAHDPIDARDRVVRDQRLARHGGCPADHRRARRARSRRGGHEELYIVLSGRATFTLDGEQVAAPRGRSSTSRILHASQRRCRRSGHRDPRRRGPARGGVHRFALGALGEALRLWTTEEWDRAIEILKAQLAQDPVNANVFYNLACAESRGGYRDAALEHLRRAIDLQPDFAKLAREDADLDAIRGDDRFPLPRA